MMVFLQTVAVRNEVGMATKMTVFKKDKKKYLFYAKHAK